MAFSVYRPAWISLGHIIDEPVRATDEPDSQSFSRELDVWKPRLEWFNVWRLNGWPDVTCFVTYAQNFSDTLQPEVFFLGGGGGITPEINNFGFDFETVTNLWSYFIPKLELFMLVGEFQVKILNEADLHIELPRLATLSRQFIFSWDHLHVSLEAVKYDVGELKVGCNQLEVIR